MHPTIKNHISPCFAESSSSQITPFVHTILVIRTNGATISYHCVSFNKAPAFNINDGEISNGESPIENKINFHQ